MNELIKEARGLLGVMTADIADDGYFECREAEHNTIKMLCDALEKAQEQNKQLLHEVCKLACESVERDKALARLEAEVEGWAKAKQEGRLVVLPCKVGDTVNTKRGKAEVVAWDTTARVKIIGEPDFVKRYRDYDIGSKIFAAEAALKGE